MPLESFEGETFVAFLDISGFKRFMQNENEALRVLDKFYNSGYEILQIYHFEIIKVDGLFVSDCAVLFIRGDDQNTPDVINSFKTILSAVRGINKKMLRENYMLTTSIAYGKFKYQKRLEFKRIEKNLIYGNAYVSAYLDNESGKPKIESGQCRILNKKLPRTVKEAIKRASPENILSLVKEREGDRGHLYYYWMLDDSIEIDDFESQYTNAYDLTHSGILTALKRQSGSQSQ